MKVHILGIGGSGASAIAAIARAQGFEVTGCDRSPFNEYTKDIPREDLFEGHSENHLEGIDILAVTPAIFSADPDNAELKAAKEKGIEVLTWQEFMGQYLEKDKFVVAICGTHGKSTTTAMTGLVLEAAGLDPTVELGATVNQWGDKNYRIGQSKYFVSEADEFNRNFLVTHPDVAIVTNIEMDHPETFKDFDEYKMAFAEFLSHAKTIIANTSNESVMDVLSQLTNEPIIIDYSQNLIDFPLEVMGEYNRLNATAAFNACLSLDIKPEITEKALSKYSGIGRRLQLMGKKGNIQIYSDYGHHPTEVKVTVEGLRESFKDEKIWLVYQPHMFTRTKALWNDFIKVFQELPIEKTLIMDIFKSREEAIPDISSEKLVQAISNPKVEYISDDKVLDSISNEADIVLFMGAGPIHELAKRLIAYS